MSDNFSCISFSILLIHPDCPEGTIGDAKCGRSPGLVQLLQHFGILHSIMSVVAFSQEALDHELLGVTAQTKQVLAKQEGVQEPRHHLLELMQEGAILQPPGEHRCIEALCIVGRQQHWTVEGAQEGDEISESLGKRDGVHGNPVEKEVVVADSEARDTFCALCERLAGEDVDIKDPVFTDGAELNDVTHRGV